MKYIFGSGLIGLLARFILGPEWTVIPFYKSRFFSFNPALDDNYIIRDDRLDEFVKDLGRIYPNKNYYVYKRVWSVGGQLFQEYDKSLLESWLGKVFGSNVPSQSEAYFSKKMNMFVYDIRANHLYELLLKEYMEDLRRENALGKVTEVGENYFIRNNKRYDFDNLVNTIPLDSILDLMKIKNDLKSKTLHYIHVQSTNLDFEGANQVLVADELIDFYKVTNIAPNRYLFYCHNDINDPGIYLMNYMKDFDILDGTSIANVIPMGEIPKIAEMERYGIFNIGSSAQWDWCMDLSSCILRVMKYAQRGFKKQDTKSFVI